MGEKYQRSYMRALRGAVFLGRRLAADAFFGGDGIRPGLLRICSTSCSSRFNSDGDSANHVKNSIVSGVGCSS